MTASFLTFATEDLKDKEHTLLQQSLTCGLVASWCSILISSISLEFKLIHLLFFIQYRIIELGWYRWTLA